jgi:hypothetical protein
MQIDVLPDDVLLGIFDFYVNMYSPSISVKTIVEEWQSLVHVCRRWRNLVLGSPRRLNLRLYCTPETPARDTLDVWPPLPLIVYGNMEISLRTDNVIAALGQSNHVCEVDLRYITGWQLEEVLAAMQVPFPELTDLELRSDRKTMPVVPDSFLDGSAPRLRLFTLHGIPFPGLPKLLFSANHLVRLWLYDIPHSGYISPEAMVALLSVLSSLTTFYLKFQSPQSRPDWETRRPPPPKRSDTPRLNRMNIYFFNQIDFDTPLLAQFINRTVKLKAHDKARVLFRDDFALVGLLPGNLQIEISCREPDWQLSSIEQICNSSLHPLSTAEDLYIDHQYSELVWMDDAIENSLWLQLLLPFTALKNLYLSKEFAPGIAAALQGLVGDRIPEVLPSLQNIFVKGLDPSGSFQGIIGQFVAARQLSNHPIAISDWEKGYDIESM